MGQTNTSKKYLENLIQNYPKSLIEDLYIVKTLSKAQIAKQLNITLCAIEKLVKTYELTQAKHLMRSKQNSVIKNQFFNDTKERISKEDLIKYYIEEDHGYEETQKYFNITEWTFCRLLKEYDIKKDRSKSFKKGLEKRIEHFGLDNLTNWKKAHETRIKNSGSLENSYKEGYEKQIETMLERYGVTCSFLKDDVNTKKKHSAPNEKFEKLLNLNNIKHEREFCLDKRAFDFKVENKLIEINPIITHNSNFNPFDKQNNYKGLDKNYHHEKSKLAIQNGYQCIHVWPWDDLDKIIQLIKPREKINARDCEIRELELSECRDFINTYHIQNYIKCNVKIGLFYQNDLVSVMTFGKPRYNSKYQYELIRYCSKYNITGGAQKLFSYFLKKYNPESIISYCDMSKFSGKVYEQLNFTLKQKGVPTRHWCNLKLEHYLDSTIRKKGFSRIIHGCEPSEDNLETNDNYELMRNEGFLEVFDCGQATYVWKRKAI